MRKLSKTNPIPKGTQNVPVNMPVDMAKKLSELAKSSGMSRSAYCVEILNEAVANWRVLKAQIVTVSTKFPPHRPGAYEMNDDSGLGPEHKG